MTMSFIFLTMINFSFLLFLFSNPLAMGLLILIQTFLLALIISLSIHSSWFAYILFLTFLGGLLILFIYTASFSSNEMFKFNFNELMFLILIMIINFIVSIFVLNYTPHLIYYFNNLEMNQFNNIEMFMNNENTHNNSQLYSSKFKMTMMMILFLLISMTIINKISNPFLGTFRNNNKKN